MMIRSALAALILTGALGACGGGAPDEFVVVSKPDLVVPPDFALRPPRQGVSQKQDIDTQAQAIDALFPGRTQLPPLSRGEQALLDKVGEPAPGARAQLRNLEPVVVRKDPLLADLLTSEDRDLGLDGITIEKLSSTPQG